MSSHFINQFYVDVHPKMRSPISYVFLLTLLGFATAGRHDIYSGFSVYEVWADTSDQLASLGSLVERLNLDEWRQAVNSRPGQVMVSPDQKEDFLEELERSGLSYETQYEDVARLLEEQDEQSLKWKSSRSFRAIPFEDYPRHDEVNAYLQSLAAAHPDVATLETIGQSYEGRDIMLLRISTTNFQNASKPIYFVDAMIHAREWVTTPVTLYILHRLLEERRTEDADLLEDIDWIVLPVVNPDGYEYTHTDARLWRTTRSYNADVSATCYGVDANRNFDVAWNKSGVSADPCATTYPGAAAFSEVETRLVRDLMFQHLERIALYMNIHSHGNYVLFGYGDRSLPANTAQLHHMGALMGAVMDAVKLPAAFHYLVGNSAAVLYSTSGSAQDYAQSIGVPFSYTLELPGYGFAFQVPYEYIPHLNEETFLGVAATARLSKLYFDARLGN